jgi:uncharacterized membrane protein YdbT with pleckstrin-like domain
MSDAKPHMRLHDGESILHATRRSGWLVAFWRAISLGLFTFWWRVGWIVVTNQRVYLKQGILNKSERSLPLRFVQDATVRRNWLGVAEVSISTAGGAEGVSGIYPLTGSDGRQLADIIMAEARRAWPARAA